MAKRRLKSGLLYWRDLSPKTQSTWINRYGSKEAAQRVRRVLPVNKLSPKTQQRLIKQYGTAREAQRTRIDQAMIRFLARQEEKLAVKPTELEPETRYGPFRSVREINEERSELVELAEEASIPYEHYTREEWTEIVNEQAGTSWTASDRELWEGYRRNIVEPT